ncbi:hypothetical protein ACTFIZ_011988 [Dictyostelium cf. discoideum]
MFHTYAIPEIISIIIILSSSIFILFFKKDKQKLINNNKNNNKNKNNDNDEDVVIEDNLKPTDYDIVIDLQDTCWAVNSNKDLFKNVIENSETQLECLLEGSNKFRTATIVGYYKGKTFVAGNFQ